MDSFMLGWSYDMDVSVYVCCIVMEALRWEIKGSFVKRSDLMVSLGSHNFHQPFWGGGWSAEPGV